MAKKGWNTKGGNTRGAVAHAALGAVPFGNLYEGYKGAKGATGKRSWGVAGAVAASATYPIGGVALGAYHGAHSHTGMHPNQRNAKTAIRSSNPHPVKSKSRVGTKGY